MQFKLHMHKLKENITLIIGLAIPVVMMAVIAAVIYLPQWLNPTIPPMQDFIYGVGDNIVFTPSASGMSYPYPYKGVWPKYHYQVIAGKIVKVDAGPVPEGYGKMAVIDEVPKFYVYHVKTKQSEALTFEQATLLNLDTSARSIDGFTVVRGSSRGGQFFPFFYDGGGDYNKIHLQKQGYNEDLTLNLPESYYQDFFIAWVINK